MADRMVRGGVMASIATFYADAHIALSAELVH